MALSVSEVCGMMRRWSGIDTMWVSGDKFTLRHNVLFRRSVR